MELRFWFILSVQQIELIQTSQNAVLLKVYTNMPRVQSANPCIKITYLIATTQSGTSCKNPTLA